MLELDRKVFGEITTKEIIGARPPEIPDTRDILERELGLLLGRLGSQPRDALEAIIREQELAGRHVNSRPGAMALAQGKIRLFNEYNSRYVGQVRRRLASCARRT